MWDCSKLTQAVADKVDRRQWLRDRQRASKRLNMVVQLVRALTIFCAGALLPFMLG